MRWPTYCSNGSPPSPSELKRQRAHWTMPNRLPLWGGEPFSLVGGKAQRRCLGAVSARLAAACQQSSLTDSG
jgi:hypothetical protein